MATRNMRYRKRHYGLLDEETSFQVDRMFRIAAQGKMRANRCDRKYESNAQRQAAYRQRLQARKQPLTQGQWEMLASMFIAGLKGQTLTRMQCATLAFNTLLCAHGTGLCIELSDPTTR